MLTHDTSTDERLRPAGSDSPTDSATPVGSGSTGGRSGPDQCDGGHDRTWQLAEAASALGVMPAACAVLRDPTAPGVLRDRACFVVERALREHSELSS